MNWLAKISIRFIEHYQQKGGGKELFYLDCNYIPSCSEYAKQALKRFGFLFGGWLAIKRILSCNQPDLTQQIHDPVPDKGVRINMLSKKKIEQQEEKIREEINQLPDDQRKQFYSILKNRVKDPDTYAVLNWFFVAGLHHFYLRRIFRGLINLSVFLTGIVLILTGFGNGLGILLILGIFIIELYALFRSQSIVQNYNNKISRKVLDSIKLQE